MTTPADCRILFADQEHPFVWYVLRYGAIYRERLCPPGDPAVNCWTRDGEWCSERLLEIGP